MKRPLKFLAKHRSITALIIVGMTLVLSIVGYGAMSRHMWQDYEKNYLNWQQTVQAQAKRTFALHSTDEKEKLAKITAMTELHRLVQSGDSLCQVHPIFAWQEQVFEVTKQRVAQCVAATNKVLKFGEAIQPVLSHLGSERAVTDILLPLTATAIQDETKWSGQVLAWQTAKDKIAKLHVIGSFQDSRKLAEVKAEAIRAAWQQLIDANGAHDRTKYDEATAALAVSYGGLNEVVESGEHTLLPLLSSLQGLYAKAF